MCFFWGTTYLTIRMALESFPPLLLVSLRFICAGALMLGFARLRGIYLPRGRELATACLTGFFTLTLGNGFLVFAELLIPSGMAGLIITISPFWLVGMEALLPGGERLHAPTIAGMAVGLAGAALLFTPGAAGGGIDHKLLMGFLLLELGGASWAFGSIFQRRQPNRAHPVIVGAVQQLAAGLILAPAALLIHEHPVDWAGRGVWAGVYLVFFGSIVGYSAYAYALDRLPVAIVSIYPYVNAVVAVLLGWLVYRERFGVKEAFAMLVIFAGVGIVKRFSRPPRGREPVARSDA